MFGLIRKKKVKRIINSNFPPLFEVRSDPNVPENQIWFVNDNDKKYTRTNLRNIVRDTLNKILREIDE